MNLTTVVKEYLTTFADSCDGDFGPQEADERVNDACRKVIRAMKEQYGEVWLGKINLYDKERHGGAPVLWRWDGSMVYNFSCAFCLPRFDAELQRLIRERDDAAYNAANDIKMIREITKRIKELGGINLVWA